MQQTPRPAREPDMVVGVRYRRLEQFMREGLAAHADDAAASVDQPVGSRPAPVRRRTAWLAAAAAVLAVVGGVPLIQQLTAEQGESTTAPGNDVASWRVESYAGVQVKVPPTWGWGGAPVVDDACGVTRAFVVPGSDKYEFVDRATPFVGRPASMTDACQLTWHDPVPEVDSVWLGSPLEPGTVIHENGQVSETFRVGDQHVTVFSRDAELRQRIRSTASTFDVDANGCPTESTDDAVPVRVDMKPTSLSVCVYNDPFGEEVLLWSGRRDASAAIAYVEAFANSSGMYHPVRRCERAQEGPHVTLGVHGTSGGQSVTRWDYVNFECVQIGGAYLHDGDKVSDYAAPLRKDTAEPWAGGGTLAYVHLPPNFPVELKAWFRGPLG